MLSNTNKQIIQEFSLLQFYSQIRKSMVYQTLAFLIISICSIQVIIKQFEIGILQEVLYQLEQKNLKPFLQDVKIVQGENPVCPSEYPLTISQYEWAGTTEGCLCKEGGIDNKYCCPAGVCKNFTCEGDNISPTEAMNLNYWKNQNNDKNVVICGKFMQEISAKSQTDLKESQSGLCLDDENYKVCKSENQLTDFNICVPKSKEFLKIDDQQYVYINRQANQLPIIEFKIQNDMQICFNENEEIKDEEKERDEYLLLKNQKRQVKSCIQNSNWNKMATIKKIDLYKANKDFYSETIENLPQFKLHKYDEFHLLYLNAQPVKSELQQRWINGQEQKQSQIQKQQNQRNGFA
ncbi:hypothetical protein PPERSA_12412 [Pseudocohnilembus persalinus]|uniref:Transmembrane protein n=1 Tax=Pseudocohnilembus persalinus TaxID=266149 RepID=A0A0V0QP80_PSEPJ|nr:hypothetical protein PPERSA_12412 [Pseudocohnilembus persalinus]|eukprot:KRX03965.1 hypothetical protein PPERSA_12412 [Pseudocohnilembus persalinus]